MIEECERLRRDNQRLTDEVASLRAEVSRLTSAASGQHDHASASDDSARRFMLLELD